MSAPDPALVRAQLERIVSSATFAGSDRMSRLLRYVVDRTLAGEADQVKEYVLGVEVFDRDDRYDPRLDSIVRVEARRLRSKLDEYYGGPGAADPVAIDMPKGSYVPVFTLRAAPAIEAPAVAPAARVEPAAQPSALRASSGPSVKGGVAAALLAAAVLALVIGSAWRVQAPAPVTVQARGSGVSIAVLPFLNHASQAGDGQAAARLTDGVTTELARLGALSVVSHTSARQFAGARQSLREVARTLGADVVLEGTVTVEGEKLVVESRLVNAWTDRKVWVHTFEGDARQIRTLQREIAATVSPVAAKMTPQPQ